MAIYRQVHVSFWQDSFILDLTPEEKYFYLYLMTNSKTSQCGAYEIPKKVIELETGYNRETVDKLLQRFIDYGKIEYCDSTKEILLKNWYRHNSSKSPKVVACVTKEVEKIKSTEFKRYCTDTVCIEWGEKEEQKEEQKQKEKEKEEEVKPKSIKHKYGLYKNVLLSNEDYFKLTSEFPNDYYDRIERLSEGIASKGYKYTNHLATIRSWARKDNEQSGNPFKELLRKEMQNDTSGSYQSDDSNQDSLPNVLQITDGN